MAEEGVTGGASVDDALNQLEGGGDGGEITPGGSTKDVIGGNWEQYKTWRIDIKSAVAQKEERAAKVEACKGLSIFVAFLVCYITMLKLQLNVESAYVMEEGMRSSLLGLSSGFTVDATVGSPMPDGSATLTGTLSDDVDWDTVTDAVYFWDWVTGAIVPAVYSNAK